VSSKHCATQVRNFYNAYYGEDGLKNPTAEDWAAFAASCNLRDMGTHLCALPTGEHCPKGLICLGCAHAQPKKSAVPTFRRVIATIKWPFVAGQESLEVDTFELAATIHDQYLGQPPVPADTVTKDHHARAIAWRIKGQRERQHPT
jgi:hypothetical protein